MLGTECHLQTLKIEDSLALDLTFDWENCPQNGLNEHVTLEVRSFYLFSSKWNNLSFPFVSLLIFLSFFFVFFLSFIFFYCLFFLLQSFLVNGSDINFLWKYTDVRNFAVCVCEYVVYVSLF